VSVIHETQIEFATKESPVCGKLNLGLIVLLTLVIGYLCTTGNTTSDSAGLTTIPSYMLTVFSVLRFASALATTGSMTMSAVRSLCDRSRPIPAYIKKIMPIPGDSEFGYSKHQLEDP
jgi:hypothetical protein